MKQLLGDTKETKGYVNRKRNNLIALHRELALEEDMDLP